MTMTEKDKEINITLNIYITTNVVSNRITYM